MYLEVDSQRTVSHNFSQLRYVARATGHGIDDNRLVPDLMTEHLLSSFYTVNGNGTVVGKV